jgi:hypothetical protein
VQRQTGHIFYADNPQNLFILMPYKAQHCKVFASSVVQEKGSCFLAYRPSK